MKPRMVITPGDPAGVGPELLVRSLPEILACCDPVIIDGAGLLEQAAASFGHGELLARCERVPVPGPVDTTPGITSADNGRFVYRTIAQAVSMCRDGETSAVVTLPLHKQALAEADLKWPGHTEMLRDLAGVPHTMMLFASPGFHVALHTIHEPLHRVPPAVTTERLLEGIRFAWENTRCHLPDVTRLVVCGLNPHAGEGGRLGSEDAAIEAAIHVLRSEGMPVSGPHPADTLFYRLPRDGSVLVYAMYHDQGLIPIKTLYPTACVNMTLGLPFIRTSVSHGTAFDIAWQGKADIRNFVETVRWTANLLRRRT